MVPLLHGAVFWLVLAVLWIIPAGLVARSAERRGHGFRAWFVVALFFPWPLVLVVVSFLSPRPRKE